MGRISYHFSVSLDIPFFGGKRRYTSMQMSAALTALWVMG
jgi:hypothetical protein